jgi:predicted RNA binding protein with dsRBD fold (UPF0201 family)
MTIDKVQEQEANSSEKKPITVQLEIQKELLKEEIQGGNTQKQVIQLLAGVGPQQQIQDTAKNQLSKGFVDIKI